MTEYTNFTRISVRILLLYKLKAYAPRWIQPKFKKLTEPIPEWKLEFYRRSWKIKLEEYFPEIPPIPVYHWKRYPLENPVVLKSYLRGIGWGLFEELEVFKYLHSRFESIRKSITDIPDIAWIENQQVGDDLLIIFGASLNSVKLLKNRLEECEVHLRAKAQNQLEKMFSMETKIL